MRGIDTACRKRWSGPRHKGHYAGNELQTRSLPMPLVTSRSLAPEKLLCPIHRPSVHEFEGPPGRGDGIDVKAEIPAVAAAALALLVDGRGDVGKLLPDPREEVRLDQGMAGRESGVCRREAKPHDLAQEGAQGAQVEARVEKERREFEAKVPLVSSSARQGEHAEVREEIGILVALCAQETVARGEVHGLDRSGIPLQEQTSPNAHSSASSFVESETTSVLRAVDIAQFHGNTS